MLIRLMKLFYQASIESAISFSTTCWYGNLCIRDKNQQGKIVKVASKVIGAQQMNSLEQIFSRQVLSKALSVRSDAAHPLDTEYDFLPSGLRLQVPPATKNKNKKTQTIQIFLCPRMHPCLEYCCKKVKQIAFNAQQGLSSCACTVHALYKYLKVLF